MNCQAVRDRLPEHALGVVDHHDEAAIERHLAWCAACRKEARDLERSAATMAFALAPAHVGRQLEERVVGAVRRVAGPSPAPKPARRRGRRAGVVFLAAALTIAGLGAGAVLARRDGPPADPATPAQQQESAFERFQRFITSATQTDPQTKAFVGLLTAPRGGSWKGAALTIISPNGDDQVVVTVDGLHEAGLPYRVQITDGRGHAVNVSRITHVDKGGAAMVARQVGRDLSSFVRVVIRDARGHIVLAGGLDRASASG